MTDNETTPLTDSELSNPNVVGSHLTVYDHGSPYYCIKPIPLLRLVRQARQALRLADAIRAHTANHEQVGEKKCALCNALAEFEGAR